MTETTFPRYGKARSIRTGFKRQCPSCEEGKIFAGYLKLKTQCPTCAAPIGEIRADDFPPYLTIFIVGHILVPALVFVEINYHPPMMFQMILWPSLALILSLSLLPILKGAVIGFIAAQNKKDALTYPLIALVCGIIILVAGYYIFEAAIYPLLAKSIPFFGVTDAKAALAEIVPNLLQGVISAVIAFGIWRVFKGLKK